MQILPGLARVDPTKTVDHYDLDDGDATHPIYLDYMVPANASGIIKVTLSWKMRAFRSTVGLNISTIGNDATAESGHSHSHSHTGPSHNHAMQIAGGVAGQALTINVGGPMIDAVGGPFNDSVTMATGGTGATGGNAVGSSGHSHNHNHSLSGSGAQSVTDGPVATIESVAIDGVDLTAALGGPWIGDVVELDISSVFATMQGQWHELALGLSGLGRVVSLLRIYHTT